MINPWVTQLRKGLLELSILNALAQQESYGYEIVQRLKQVEGMAVTESTAYPILSRLKTDGCLRVREVASSDGPPRRYFSLTDRGFKRLEEMNEHWDKMVDSIASVRAEASRHAAK
jgi:PadR family transcriptional regulator, regulatory protein PadR